MEKKQTRSDVLKAITTLSVSIMQQGIPVQKELAIILKGFQDKFSKSEKQKSLNNYFK